MMPNTGGPLGPLPAPTDPAALECSAAWQARYDECLAAGMGARRAGIEAAKASAECRRVQLGLPAVDPGDIVYEQLQAERRARAGG